MYFDGRNLTDSMGKPPNNRHQNSFPLCDSSSLVFYRLRKVQLLCLIFILVVLH